MYHVLWILNIFADLPDRHGIVFRRSCPEIIRKLLRWQAFLFVLGYEAIPNCVSNFDPALLFLWIKKNDLDVGFFKAFKSSVFQFSVVIPEKWANMPKLIEI